MRTFFSFPRGLLLIGLVAVLVVVVVISGSKSSTPAATEGPCPEKSAAVPPKVMSANPEASTSASPAATPAVKTTVGALRNETRKKMTATLNETSDLLEKFKDAYSKTPNAPVVGSRVDETMALNRTRVESAQARIDSLLGTRCDDEVPLDIASRIRAIARETVIDVNQSAVTLLAAYAGTAKPKAPTQIQLPSIVPSRPTPAATKPAAPVSPAP